MTSLFTGIIHSRYDGCDKEKQKIFFTDDKSIRFTIERSQIFCQNILIKNISLLHMVIWSDWKHDQIRKLVLFQVTFKTCFEYRHSSYCWRKLNYSYRLFQYRIYLVTSDIYYCKSSSKTDHLELGDSCYLLFLLSPLNLLKFHPVTV